MSRFLRVLLVIVVVAFGVRVAYVALAKSSSCVIRVGTRVIGTYPSECAVGDQLFYNAEANTVAKGNGFTDPLWSLTHTGSPPPAADHPPLTVMVLAPVSWLFDHEPFSAIASDPLGTHVREHRYTMVLLGTLLVFLIGLVGRRVGGDTVGLVAAGIAAVTPNLWVNDGLIMSETVTGLTVVGAMLLAFGLRDRPTRWRAAALGAVCGLAALARAELILFVPLLAIVACVLAVHAPRDRLDDASRSRRLRRRAARATPAADGSAVRRVLLAGIATLAGLAVIAPWVGYNLARFHDPIFISTNDGLALGGSNCALVYFGHGIGLTAIKPPDACVDTVHPPPGDQSQVSTVWRRQAFHYMRRHAGRLPIVMAARIGRTWSLYRPLDMVAFNKGEGREPWVTRLGLVAYYPTLVAALGGAVVLWRRRARFALWVLLVPAVALTVGVALTYGQTRFRAAAEPSLAIAAAVGVVALVQKWRPRAVRGAVTADL